MKRRLTRAVVPVIGLLAVTGALALVATAPVVLFSPSNEAGRLPSAPAASSEVARVTAPRFHPQRPSSPTTADETPEAQEGTSTGGALAVNAPIGEFGGATAGKTATPRRAARTGGSTAEEPVALGHTGQAKAKGQSGQHSGHSGNGKAKGHYKGKAHGKAKGHSK
jgi:hypothetical protein